MQFLYLLFLLYVLLFVSITLCCLFASGVTPIIATVTYLFLFSELSCLLKEYAAVTDGETSKPLPASKGMSQSVVVVVTWKQYNLTVVVAFVSVFI